MVKILNCALDGRGYNAGCPVWGKDILYTLYYIFCYIEKLGFIAHSIFLNL